MTPHSHAAHTSHADQQPQMSHADHQPQQTDAPSDGAPTAPSLNRLAFSATVHCLTGCSIGEILGLIIGSWLGWATLPTIALAVALAFFFGYAFAMIPLLKSGLTLGQALKLALAADTVSILVMEIVDNGIMLLIPGAMDAHLTDPMFWGSLTVALGIAFVVTLPVNRWLIGRGQGHALVHGAHGHGGHA